MCFYKRNGVLMRKWRPLDAPADEEWKVKHQSVVPKVYRNEVSSIAHDSAMAGHLGVRKTHDRMIIDSTFLVARSQKRHFGILQIMSHLSGSRETKSENPSSSFAANTGL